VSDLIRTRIAHSLCRTSFARVGNSLSFLLN